MCAKNNLKGGVLLTSQRQNRNQLRISFRAFPRLAAVISFPRFAAAIFFPALLRHRFLPLRRRLIGVLGYFGVM